ncbi:MAG TPA: YggT family protein [Vicinamibacteria bacterium]|jgi:YggT family protein
MPGVEGAHALVPLIDLYTIVVIAAVIVSWLSLPPENPLVRLTRALTEPPLSLIRRVVPPIGGLDFSPMILLILLSMLRGLL